LRQRDLVGLGVSELREKRVGLQRRHQRLRETTKPIVRSFDTPQHTTDESLPPT
jgi:hypothetical protein